MPIIILRYSKLRKNYLKRYSLYVLSSKQKTFEKTISDHSKNLFRNLYDTTDLCQRIRKYADSKSNLLVQLQLLQPNGHYYEQLLQTVFSTIHESALAKPAMLDFCLQLNANNSTLLDIRNFSKKYRAEHSIYWYTKECFVYRCVNKTLRSGDIDKCYSIRFYIADLSVQLHLLKSQQQKLMKKAGMTTLYRGFRQSDDELNILRNLVGRVVAVKSFMSTSRNKDIALTYASPSDGQEENWRPVLLEIYVDLSSPTIIAADISRVSNFDVECEVLFNIGSTFRVKMLTFDTLNDIWLCQLIATNENLVDIQDFQIRSPNVSLSQLILYGSNIICSNKMIQHEQDDTINRNFKSPSNDRQRLPWLAYESIDWAYIQYIKCIIQWQQTDMNQLLNECERILEIYTQIDVQDSFDGLQIASYMNNFGYISLLCSKQSELINLFNNSLSIRKKYLPHDHILLAQSYRNLGLAYANISDYHTAFEFHERALSINQHASITAQWSTVTTLRNMGDLCHRLKNCTRAVEYYSKAIDAFCSCLSFFNSTNL
ncbi:unnamed protein product [Rotaria sordida]|uniref:ADP ribosyltransferase domain-containing protein n=1 Tax=Rotaria sordida TaxID=392033 RepID=A0A815T966_9BILA|nr:unnamed protein product [Rotaria sordida]